MDLYAASRRKKIGTSWPLWWKILLSATAIIFSLALASGGVNNRPATPTFDQFDALALCQLTIKRAAFDPEKADVPIVPNVSNNGDFAFVWGPQTKVLRLRNRIGLDAAATGECAVNATTQQIQTLIINDKKIL